MIRRSCQIISLLLMIMVMDNFGASDCWSAQFVGNWPQEKREDIADWLFSNDTLANGQPMGIGLNAWRFNIGAGSSEQGSDSQIEDVWRRAECFMNGDGSYDWEKQSGQQWFLEAAKERGVERFIGFTNSPPVWLTRNGLAHGSVSDPNNLPERNVPVYAEFLVDVARGVKDKTGVEFTHISPFNEPQWDWTGNNQEGCHMENSTARQLIQSLNSALETQEDLGTKIIISEAGEWDYLYGKGDETGNQIDYFFGTNDNPIKDAAFLDRIITAHSYYTTYPATTLTGKREAVWNKVSEFPGLSVWCTEYCPLGNADLQQLGWNRWKKDLSMHVALYAGKILYHDLIYTHASAWQWWLAISNSDYPDGLIYLDGNTTDGSSSDSKLMWTIGNYSRFIQSGSIRINARCEDEDLLVTAFMDEAGSQLTLVMLNTSDESKAVDFELDDMNIQSLRPYITSDAEEHNLSPLLYITTENIYEIPGKCAITFTGHLN